MSKDSLVKGTVILAGAAFIARFLGVIQRIPLQYMLGDAGMASYGIAYNLYFLLLTVATVGIPSTLSKMIAERHAQGQFAEAEKIYRAAIWFAVIGGVLITATLYAIAHGYAALSGDVDATWAIWALAPAMLVFPAIAMMRGYFQGHQSMLPGGLSQVVEQILRVATAVLFAFILLHMYDSVRLAAAGASFGGVAGALGALAVMLYFMRRHRRTAPVAAASTMRYRDIYKQIFGLSIPISLISLAVPMLYFIDSTITIPLLKGDLGVQTARETLGILTGRAQSLAGIPIIMAIALSMSIVPIVSAAWARKDLGEVATKASQALRIGVLSGLPIVLILAVGARAVNGSLFSDTAGSGIIAALVAGSLLQIVMMTSGAILMGLGRPRQPMRHVFIGIAVKLLASFTLAPVLGIYGIILATTLCFLVTAWLNVRAVRQVVAVSVVGERAVRLTAVVLVIALAILGIDWGMQTLGFTHTKWASLLTAGVISLVTVGLYAILLIAFRAIGEADIQLFPARVRRIFIGMSRKLGQ
jgi:stage V sporulation protein B